MPATSLHDERTEAAAELERRAFNAAFYELGLHLYWDKGTYQTMAGNSSEHDCVRGCLEREQPHLLRAYDADFLADAVIRTKQRCHQSLAASAPDVSREVDWTERQWDEVGF